MKKVSLFSGCVVLVALAVCGSISVAGVPVTAGADQALRRDFAEPSQRYWPRPLWSSRRGLHLDQE